MVTPLRVFLPGDSGGSCCGGLRNAKGDGSHGPAWKLPSGRYFGRDPIFHANILAKEEIAKGL